MALYFSDGSVYLSCEVKVGVELSVPFAMSCGLRQGCILSPLLFPLHINLLVTKLKEAEIGVKCGGLLIPVLLYADAAVIFAEDNKLVRFGLNVLAEWCSDWSVEVNVDKCGIMHMRRKGVNRMEGKFYVVDEEIGLVEEYKYLGCVVDEHVECRRMLEERGKAGARALSDWLRRYRATVGEVRGAIYIHEADGNASQHCCCCMGQKYGVVEGSSGL